MAEKATCRIVAVPPLQNTSNPDSETIAFAEKFRELRLKSLQTDPDAYASTYEAEKQRGLDQTLDRLSNPKAVHFLAVRRSNSKSASAEDGDHAVFSDLAKDDWFGFVLLIGPQEDDGSNPREFGENPLPILDADGQLSKPMGLVYRINGTFVDPAGRGKGLGTKLMHAAMDAAKAGAEKFGTNVGMRVGLAVYGHNVAAIKTYEKAGFRVVEERESKSRPGWTAVIMENVLVPMLRRSS